MADLPDDSTESIVRHAKPEDVVEVDSGNSSRVFRISCIAIKVHKLHANHYEVEKRIYERLGFHPCILRCYGQVPSGSILGQGLMFEYHKLGTLASHLGARFPSIKWPNNAAEAVQYIHSKGVVHGDIGAHNFLLSDRDTLVLADFGGSSIDGSPCMVLSSVRYTAPSYMENIAEGPTEKHDLFALGTVLYEISTNQQFNAKCKDYEVKEMFMRRDFPALRQDQDIFGLRVVIDKCWRETYNNAEEMAHELFHNEVFADDLVSRINTSTKQT